MSAGKGTSRLVWIVIMALSILFLLWTVPLLLLSGGTVIIEHGLKYAGSQFDVRTIEPAALGYFNLSMLKPLWEELWIGILGIYLAIELRRGRRFAWALGLFWGIMLIANAIIQGTYELAILNWPGPCLQTYLFLFLGVIAAGVLLIGRRAYFRRPEI